MNNVSCCELLNYNTIVSRLKQMENSSRFYCSFQTIINHTCAENHWKRNRKHALFVLYLNIIYFVKNTISDPKFQTSPFFQTSRLFCIFRGNFTVIVTPIQQFSRKLIQANISSNKSFKLWFPMWHGNAYLLKTIILVFKWSYVLWCVYWKINAKCYPKI